MKQGMFWAVAALIGVGGIAVPAAEAKEAGAKDWESLFDGKTTEGWKNPYTWGKVWVEDEEIRLQADRRFFLVTEKTYGDFEFEAQIKMPEGKANSGFMFRCHASENKVFGYQTEVDPSDRKWSGGLYDEARRGWIWPKKGDAEKIKAFRDQAGDTFDRMKWNTYRIRCQGDHLQIWVNDVKTTDLKDATDSEGHIGIQHHGEKGKIYRFRKLRIRSLASGQAGRP